MKRIALAPSILTADFGRLAEEIASVDEYVDWYHLDVMDGHYVPNITFGPSTVEAVRRATEKPLHVHLMISEPDRYAPLFVKAGAQRVSFHPETTSDVQGVIDAIRDLGAGAGLAVHPDLGPAAALPFLGSLEVLLMMTVRPGFGGQSFLHEVVPEIQRVSNEVRRAASHVEVEVDGGVNLSTVSDTVAAGADIVVAGSAIFDGVDATGAARRLRARLDELVGGQRT